jgi:D-sedoheptulose 7-phosphate isomerase
MRIKESVLESASTFTNWVHDEEQVMIYQGLLEKVRLTFLQGGKLIFVGNGGSAAEASHLAAEFIGKCSMKSKPLPAIALSDSTTQMTAISNDYGISHMFTRGIQALADKKDTLIFLSTSGSSQNILASLELCKEKKLTSSLWTSSRFSGDYSISNFTIIAPTLSTPRAQELHLTLGHHLAESIEIDYLE